MVDLKLNYPSLPEEGKAITEFIKTHNFNLDELLEFPAYNGLNGNLEIARKYLGVTHPDTSGVLACNGGNHALTCILQALREGHDHIITEPFTYPAFKAIASHFGFQLHAADFDSQGMTLEGLEKSFEKTKSRLIYLQPTIHNPTCAVMSTERRKSIAEFARERNILIIEDDAYRFLHPDPPPRFSDLAPENTFHIHSLSKPFNPLIKTAYVAMPNEYTHSVTDKIRLNSSGHSSLLSGLASFIMGNDVLNDIVSLKQIHARDLRLKLLPILDGLTLRSFPTSFHLWIQLPEKLKSSHLVNKLQHHGIIVSGGADYTVGNPGEGEKFIRVSLGAEKEVSKLEWALTSLTKLMN